MGIPLKVLIAEDFPQDLELLLLELKRGGFDPKYVQVENSAKMKAMLAEQKWDLVLSDFNMPGFNATDALTLVKEANPDLPLIIVSGAIGEEIAVELMKAGADDYILKSNLKKLCPAINRSIRDANMRLRAKQASLDAEKAAQDRENMIAVVSHDLKNPISAILLNLNLMEKFLEKPDRPNREAQMKVQIKRIHASVDRMNHLINDVLDVAKIEAGRFVVQKSENFPEELIAEVLDFFEPIAMQKSIILQTELSGLNHPAFFDREKIFQVISNLLGNAIKFTSERGIITLIVQNRTDETIFAVRDTGSGIAEKHLPHIFNRFWQVEKTARDGTGLGLSIAKGIVEAHGGKIWVESRLNHGSTFYFSVPNKA